MHQPLKWQAGFVGYHDFLSVSLSLLASGAGAGQVLESEQGAFWLIRRSYYPSIDPSLVPQNSVRIQELGTLKVLIWRHAVQHFHSCNVPIANQLVPEVGASNVKMGAEQISNFGFGSFESYVSRHCQAGLAVQLETWVGVGREIMLPKKQYHVLASLKFWERWLGSWRWWRLKRLHIPRRFLLQWGLS